jgi:hypothetical protein
MSLVAYAESELKLIGMGADTPDPMNRAMHDHIIEMVQTFAEQGHSGMSAEYALDIVGKLLRFEPLSPLTYAPDEWNEVERKKTWQNRRKATVFSVDGGRTHYDIDDPQKENWPNARN